MEKKFGFTLPEYKVEASSCQMMRQQLNWHGESGDGEALSFEF